MHRPITVWCDVIWDAICDVMWCARWCDVNALMSNRRQVISKKHQQHMMTSSNGNIFRVTGHLCGEFIGVTRSFVNGWVNNREAGDLGRYPAHYDVTVMNLGPALLTLKGFLSKAFSRKTDCDWLMLKRISQSQPNFLLKLLVINLLVLVGQVSGCEYRYNII